MSRSPFTNDDEQIREPEGGGDPDSQNQAAIEADVQRLQQERDELFDRLARATADFKNSMKRIENDMEQRAQYANSALIKSLLPVIDNFERALAVEPGKADAGSLLKGLQLVHDQWINVLKQQH